MRILLIMALLVPVRRARTCSACAYGVVADGVVDDTKSVQALLADKACAGTFVLPSARCDGSNRPAVFLLGPLVIAEHSIVRILGHIRAQPDPRKWPTAPLPYEQCPFGESFCSHPPLLKVSS